MCPITVMTSMVTNFYPERTWHFFCPQTVFLFDQLAVFASCKVSEKTVLVTGGCPVLQFMKKSPTWQCTKYLVNYVLVSSRIFWVVIWHPCILSWGWFTKYIMVYYMWIWGSPYALRVPTLRSLATGPPLHWLHLNICSENGNHSN